MTYAADATGPFYHGTRADLAPGDLLTPGNRSNYADRKLSWIVFSGPLTLCVSFASDGLRADGPRRGDLNQRSSSPRKRGPSRSCGA
jgi:hypothetical protein